MISLQELWLFTRAHAHSHAHQGTKRTRQRETPGSVSFRSITQGRRGLVQKMAVCVLFSCFHQRAVYFETFVHWTRLIVSTRQSTDLGRLRRCRSPVRDANNDVSVLIRIKLVANRFSSCWDESSKIIIIIMIIRWFNCANTNTWSSVSSYPVSFYHTQAMQIGSRLNDEATTCQLLFQTEWRLF